MIVIPTRFESLFNSDGTPTLRGATWIEAITREVNLNTPIQGIGSPEGVLTAEVGQRYLDTTKSGSHVMYIKQTGTGNTGWKLS